MTYVLKLLVLVIFVNTMRCVNANGLYGALASLGLAGENAVLDLKLLGKETRHVRSNYAELASQLTIEANIILSTIDPNLLRNCKFGSTLSARVNEVKFQVNKVSHMLASCEKDKNAKNILRFELSNLELCLRNLEIEINSIRSRHPQHCKVVIGQCIDASNKLKLCVGSKVGRM